MKKILGSIIFLSFLLAGCLKDNTINTSGGLISSGRFIEIPYSGLENFSQKAVLTAGVTAPIVIPVIINVAAADSKALDKDLTVTLILDDAVRTAYNAIAANAVKFDAIPDSCYSFPVKTGVIKAGQYLDTINITFYPGKIDPSKNYMAAVTLKDAQGQSISGNFSTVYFHTIGNPLAGNYTRIYNRWNDAVGAGAATTVGTTTQLGNPDNPTQIELQSGYGTQNGFNCRYQLSFTNTGGVLSNFAVLINPKDVTDNLTANSITLITKATIITADPVAKKFKFTFQVTNSAGSPRTFTDEFTKL